MKKNLMLAGGAVVVVLALIAVWWYKLPKRVPLTIQKTESLPEDLQPIEGERIVAPAGSQLLTFEVKAMGTRFEPASLQASVGDTVKIKFESTVGMCDFVIDEYGVRTMKVGPGQVEEVGFAADKAGTFEYYCSGENGKISGQLVVSAL